MKKIIAIVTCAVVLSGLSSCSKEEDDIWSQSSAQRTNEAITEYSELLVAAENGWVMEYFANNDEPGYPFLVKFGADGGVKIAAKNQYSSGNVYKEESSLYKLIADFGPVISFDSYNSLLHIFADPNPPVGGNGEGLGHEGDYEFVVEEATADHFRLRGKKSGILINMFKLAADRKWEDYYQAIDAVKSKLFAAGIKTLYLQVGDLEYTMQGMTDGVISFVPVGGDEVTQVVKRSYIIYTDGTVHLIEPYKGFDDKAGFAVQDFKLGEDGLLHCTNEGQSATIIGPEVSELFADQTLNWNIDATADESGNYTTMGGAFAEAYKKVVAETKSAYNRDFNYFQLRYSSSRQDYVLYVDFGRAKGNLYMNKTLEGTTLSLKYANDGDNNAKLFLRGVSSAEELLNHISSTTWNLSATSLLNPSVVKAVNANDSNDWFTFVLQ